MSDEQMGTTLSTPDFQAQVEVGSLGLQTEHALAALGLGALGLVWAIRFIFPRP